MRNLFRPPTPIAVSAPAEVVAGQPLEVTLRFVADRALEVSGGEVELVRSTAVTHFQHQWMGAGGTVGHRSTTVPSRVELDVAGPLTAGQHLVRRTRLDVPGEEATMRTATPPPSSPPSR